MDSIKAKDIKDALHKLDLIKRPYIVFMNSDDADTVRASIPKIEKDIVIQSVDYIEPGKSFVMNKRDLENLLDTYK